MATELDNIRAEFDANVAEVEAEEDIKKKKDKGLALLQDINAAIQGALVAKEGHTALTDLLDKRTEVEKAVDKLKIVKEAESIIKTEEGSAEDETAEYEKDKNVGQAGENQGKKDVNKILSDAKTVETNSIPTNVFLQGVNLVSIDNDGNELLRSGEFTTTIVDSTRPLESRFEGL